MQRLSSDLSKARSRGKLLEKRYEKDWWIPQDDYYCGLNAFPISLRLPKEIIRTAPYLAWLVVVISIKERASGKTYVAVPTKMKSNFASVNKVIIPAKSTRNIDAFSAIRPRAIGTRNNK